MNKNRQTTKPLARNHKQKNFTTNHDKKQRLVYAHNYSLKFPLQGNCRIPFSNSYYKKIKLNNNQQFLYYTKLGFVKQTSKNLIVFPYQETGKASAGSSKKLHDLLRAKCLVTVSNLRKKHFGLRVLAPLSRPSTQSYAFRDKLASEVDFTVRNEVGEIDKSKRLDSDGHLVDGGEIEFHSVEGADDYIRLPGEFKRMASVFSESLKAYNENIVLHLDVMREIKRGIGRLRPKGQRMPTSLKRSATVRGCA